MPFRLTLTHQIVIAVILGITTGLFFGELTAPLRMVGTVYTMLVEAVVFPYIICSLIHGLAKMTPVMSKRLFKGGWKAYLGLVLLVFTTLIILSQMIPQPGDNLALVSANNSAESNLLQLLIPNNIFAALSNGYVPAIVIFSILFGFAGQTVLNKTAFLDSLAVINRICIQFWQILVRWAPLAVFTLLANVAGTIQPQQLLSLSIYLFALLVGVVLLVGWIIPILITALTPLRYRQVFQVIGKPLIVATTTTISVFALPMLQQRCADLLEQFERDFPDHKEIVETTLLVSYPFSQLGSYYIYFFSLFMVYYFQQTITQLQQILLTFLTYLSAIGTPSTSINGVGFLAHYLQLPQQTTEFYVSMYAITQFLQIPLSVSGFAFVTLVITLNYHKRSPVKFKRILLHVGLFLLLVSGFVYTFNRYFPQTEQTAYTKLINYGLHPETASNVKVSVLVNDDLIADKTPPIPYDNLYQIQRRKVLRVGYDASEMPFAFFNSAGELVGYDIAYAYALAKSLHARLEFVPVDWKTVVTDLNQNKFDIVMSGANVADDRIADANVSTPYFSNPMTLIIKKEDKSRFNNLANANQIKDLKIGSNIPLADLTQKYFPNAKIVRYANLRKEGEGLLQQEADAIVTSQVRASIWIAQHDGYTAVIPKGLDTNVLQAYLIAKRSPHLLNYVNYWMSLQEKNGFQQATFNHWILAQPIFNKQRWSVIRNVLHWI